MQSLDRHNGSFGVETSPGWTARDYAIEAVRSLTATEDSDGHLMGCSMRGAAPVQFCINNSAVMVGRNVALVPLGPDDDWPIYSYAK